MTTQNAVRDLASTPLADLLDRWARASSEADVPPALREQALLGPLREFLGRPSKQFRARMVDLGFRLAGGVAGQCPPELPLLVEALHAGSLIVDDIEDGSHERRGTATMHELHGAAVALNAGNWLYFWPQVLLACMPLPEDVRLRSHERIAQCLLRCHEGQALDLTVRIWDVPRLHAAAVVRAITERKTGELVALACRLGAIAAGADSSLVDAIGRFGREVGIVLQMLDDLSGVVVDARRKKSVEDFEKGRATWIWAWLSRELDAGSYWPLLNELRRDRPHVESCLERARMSLGAAGLKGVRTQQDSVMEALREAGADDTRCREIENELAWLEHCYVGG